MASSDSNSSGSANATPPETVPEDHFRLAMIELPEDTDAAETLVVDRLGLTRIDAKTRLRHVPGVWHEALTEGQAQHVADAFNAIGARCLPVDSEKLPNLKAAPTVHHLRCLPEGLHLVSISGEDGGNIEWSHVRLISAARVRGLHPHEAGHLPDGVYRHDPGLTTSLAGQSDEEGFECWIVLNDELHAIRFDAEFMNYEYLADELAPTSKENFAHLLADLRRYAPDAIWATATEPIDEKRPDHLPLCKSHDLHVDRVLAYCALLQGE